VKNGGSLQLHDLWVDLRDFRVRGIDLDVAAGEYFVLLGPTGAGKTVLLETIAGLFRPRRGRVVMDGEEVTNAPPEHRGIGFVYQDYALFPHLNVWENIAFGLKLERPDRAAIREQVEETSQMLGIDRLLQRSPRTLSGGEQQRVALARALVVEPRLLLLDEPLSALDPETREGLQRELARVHRELGTTTLHVTHDFQEAVALGDRIAVVHRGQIVQVGTPASIFRRPASEFVARFVGVRNIFRGKLRSGGDSHKLLAVDDLDIAVVTSLAGDVHASLRPEDIILSREPLRSSARNCFCGHVTHIADRGTLVYITVSVPPDFTCVITRRSMEEMELRIDKEVYIAFKASATHVF
jgi:molybdopterin-binding protein